jgi:L-fuconolactonase
MRLDRRGFLQCAAGAAVMGAVSSATADEKPANNDTLIIDTHQHLWDLKQLKLPWLEGAPQVLKRNYRPQEYADATRGLKIKAVYMEVDVDPSHHDKEAEYVIGLCRGRKGATIAAVIGGRPASADFEKYVLRHKAGGYVKGVRQVLHSDTARAGTCLQDDFVRGVRTLGKHGLSFDLCMRPTELKDGIKLAELCADTRFVVDHCGNADPKAFSAKLAGDEKPWHTADGWRRDMEGLAKRPNVICKISGIVARAPKGWTAEDLAPIVNHCLDTFGLERVVFGGDWPVCLLGSPLRGWVAALREIVASRPAADQAKLWSENAVRFYGLKV